MTFLSERQYKGAFKRWKLKKNASKSDMQHMHRIRDQRLKEGKATEFLLQKRAVPDSKIDRWAQRTRHEAQSSPAPQNSALDLTPPTIEYRTPPINNVHIASISELLSFKNEIANKVYPDGLIDFGSAMAQSSIGMPLSTGYDVRKWFAQNEVELASTVAGELDRVAKRIQPAEFTPSLPYEVPHPAYFFCGGVAWDAKTQQLYCFNGSQSGHHFGSKSSPKYDDTLVV